MPSLQDIKVETACAGAVRRLVVDRPKGNVHTQAVMAELCTQVEQAAPDAAIKLITIEGAGNHFSYGASIEEHAPAKIRDVLPGLRKLVLAVARSPVPVAALVQGVCFGGAFELVCACHFVFATPDTRMALPEIKLGVFPPAACALLPLRTNQAVTDRLVLTGEEMSATQLHALGFVHSIFKAGGLWEGVEAWFNSTLAAYSASSIRHANIAARRAFLTSLEDNLVLAERAYLGPLMDTHDAREGIDAYLAKVPPAWRNQ